MVYCLVFAMLLTNTTAVNVLLLGLLGIVWSLYEQICVAALETGDQALADECIAQLLKKFPDSIRAGRLLGLQKEQVGESENECW